MRNLSVHTDDRLFSPNAHFRLTGKTAIGLFPSLFVLQAWNLAESDYLQLFRTKVLTVYRDNSCLAYGFISDVIRKTVPEGTVTSAAFSLGLDLWNAQVALSLEAGVSVSETVRRLLDVSGTGISLLSLPGDDPILSRGQAFLGRAAECIACALSAASARGVLVPAGLCVVPKEPLPATLHLTEQDLTDLPAFAGGGRQMILRTNVTGFQPGEEMEIEIGRRKISGLILERFTDADNVSGPWRSEILIALREKDYLLSGTMSQ